MVNSDAEIRPLSELNHLSHLTLVAEAGFSSTTPFSDAGVNQLNFSSWRQLQYLAISSPNMTNVSLQGIRKIPNLRTLEIYCTSSITDDGIPILADMSALVRLDLRGTGISREGTRRLKEALPNCHIIERDYQE